MDTTEARIAALEDRLQHLEDERDVARLIASYGPLVDSGSAAEVGSLFEPEADYDVDELAMHGREQVEAMVRSANHARWIDGGCAHVVGPPHVTVRDATAVAVCHSLMVVHDGERFVLRRATANLWRLAKGTEGWRVTSRTNRVLDGRSEAPRLLATGMGVDVPP